MTIAQRIAVTDTSVQVYREEAVMVGLRERTVLGWLISMGVVTDPTSAELAIFFRLSPQMADFDGPTARALFVRRGLSGLKALGKVEHGEPRICTVSHRRTVTWRAVDEAS